MAQQNLYIAPMSNPWTISGPRVRLAKPTLAWESWILEGPVVLQRNGKVFVVYAANKSWTDNECLGMLVNTDGDYLNAASWTKLPQPIFQDHHQRHRWRFMGPATVASPNRWTERRTGSSITPRNTSGVGLGLGTSGCSASPGMRTATRASDSPCSPAFPWPTPPAMISPPPLLQSVTLQTNGQTLVTARAPLPLSTNRWAVEFSGNLSNWSSLSSISGMQFSATILDSTAATNRYYRVKSSR